MIRNNSARVVRRTDYVSMPWRNGGGVTFEIARSGRSLAEFDWRLSLARIEQSGPFSRFDGYQRAISLVSGAGCILSGIREKPLRLDAARTTALFAGSAVVECELVRGPCEDLNLMVRDTGRIISAGAAVLVPGRPLALPAAEERAVFCLGDPVECVGPGGQQLSLGKHDTLLVGAAAREWSIQPVPSTGARILIYAWSMSR